MVLPVHVPHGSAEERTGSTYAPGSTSPGKYLLCKHLFKGSPCPGEFAAQSWGREAAGQKLVWAVTPCPTATFCVCWFGLWCPKKHMQPAWMSSSRAGLGWQWLCPSHTHDERQRWSQTWSLPACATCY